MHCREQASSQAGEVAFQQRFTRRPRDQRERVHCSVSAQGRQHVGQRLVDMLVVERRERPQRDAVPTLRCCAEPRNGIACLAVSNEAPG